MNRTFAWVAVAFGYVLSGCAVDAYAHDTYCHEGYRRAHERGAALASDKSLEVLRLGPDDPSMSKMPYCQKLSSWSGYAAAAPAESRDILYKLSTCGPSIVEESRRSAPIDPFILAIVDYDSLVNDVRNFPQGILTRKVRWSSRPDRKSSLEEYITVRRCAGLPEDDDLVRRLVEEKREEETRLAEEKKEAAEKAAKVAAEEERHRCIEDPKCSAEMDRKDLAHVIEMLCEEHGQREMAIGAIREEWRQAHQETGIVDVDGLDRLRSLKEMHEGTIADLEHSYTSLTKKRFSPKRECKKPTAAASE